MNKLIGIMVFSFLLSSICWAGGNKDKTAQSKNSSDTASEKAGLLSLDEAIAIATKEIETALDRGTEIAVYKITASHDKIGDYIADSLNDSFLMHKKLVPLARETVLQYASTEQQFQLSGFVSDESAVSIGQYLGAKVVITGTFDSYADFSQLRLRAVDVRTSALVAAYAAQIENKDPLLVNITVPLRNTSLPHVADSALAALNRGKDLFTEGKYDEAIREFTDAIRLDPNFSDAYSYRARLYTAKEDIDRALADSNTAIKLYPNNAIAYYARGNAYIFKRKRDLAIADYNQAIKLDPNYALAYINRSVMYSDDDDNDRAIADATKAISIEPSNAVFYAYRGYMYNHKDDYDRAIADANQAIKLNPNYAFAYIVRAAAYLLKKDENRGITDYNQAIKIEPKYADLNYIAFPDFLF